ncbi:LCP family protein [Lactobacillus agrestimuris]|uniref:LCP family protein n=1 Tax=Lactobacillus agrestimuris TaxID=2941328 RepID=UPI0020446725|nr:LCP family protein [Lactobacillus agrestimuris]
MSKKKTPSQEEIRDIMRKNDHQPKKHLLIWMIFAVLAVIIGAGGLGYYYLHSVTNKISANHSSKDLEQLKKGKPISILVMGTDVGALGRGNSYAGNTDTMELITINPTQGRTVITAIPRDTLVEVNTKDGKLYEKINAAYAIGGPKLAKKQVSELLDVPVNYYALMNMGTLEKIVDSVGGVEVDNPFAFTFEGHKYVKGKQELNGKQALGYSRMRYDDPNNDYGRQRRAQQVLISAIEKFKTKGNLLSANKMLVAVKDGVRTDLPLDDLSILYKNYANAMNSTQQEQLIGKDAQVDGIDFQIATPNEINRISKQVRHSMGIRPVNVSNNETELVQLQTSWNGYNNLNFTLPNGAKYNQLQK